MVDRGYFAHETPEGVSPARRVRETGYLRRTSRWWLGENLAWSSGPPIAPAAVVQMWLDSPPHRAVMLSRRPRDGGVGLADGVPAPDARPGTTFALELGRRRAR
jgi:uncharacterized protein YkwD